MVAAGNGRVPPKETRRLISEIARSEPRPDHEPPGYEQLTGREREVLEHVARRLSNREIAVAQ